MNVKMQNRNLLVSKSLENLVQRKAQKVRKMLPSYSPHDLDLAVSVQKMSKGKQYQTSLVLTTPQTVLRVEDVKENVTTSVVRAFDELLRKIKRFKSQLNRERYWQKEPDVGVDSSAPVQVKGFEGLISSNLEKIENYIRRELYHRALAENFPPGVLHPQALVDRVFLEVSARGAVRPENLSVEQWLVSLAREMIDRAVQEVDAGRSRSRLEEPSKVESRWEDEVLNFYQPDEALRLEDLLSDQSSTTPEEWLEKEETEELVQKAVARLPGAMRESFVLFALEGFNSDEVAMLTGRPTDQVLLEIEQAREQLRRFMDR